MSTSPTDDIVILADIRATASLVSDLRPAAGLRQVMTKYVTKRSSASHFVMPALPIGAGGIKKSGCTGTHVCVCQLACSSVCEYVVSRE